jgi:hypothetical protein
MRPDDLLCSRNARLKKALVGRAQWKIYQVPSLKRKGASLEGSFNCGSSQTVRLARRTHDKKDGKSTHFGPVLPERAP